MNEELPSRPIWMSGGLPYPLLVYLTRYGGTYEGGKWAALNREEIPPEATGSDIECCDFWSNVALNQGVIQDQYGAIVFGVGETPDEAISHCTEMAKAYNARLAQKS